MIIPENRYKIYPPESAIQTQKIEKPEPESDPVPIWESDRLLDTSAVGHGKDRAILFSGGDDSLALTHYCLENDLADFVIHLATGTSIPENTDYVRSVCQANGWPLAIIRSPMPFDVFAFRYGFPGSSCHNMAYRYLKSRQLSYFSKHRQGDVKFLSGVRKLESDRRMKNVSAEVQYEDISEGGDFTGWWISPLIDKSDRWVRDYRNKHGLRQNPVSAEIHRSADCQCLSYGHRDTELTMIQSEYPEFTEWLLNVEIRVQEYRGRVYLLEDNYPDIASKVASLREDEEPYPMKLSVLQEHFPGVYDDIVHIDGESAILRGQMEPTSYIGHGGLSSEELRSKMSRADPSQKTLCENCEAPANNISQSVQRQQQQAQEAFSSDSIQTTLPTGARSA